MVNPDQIKEMLHARLRPTHVPSPDPAWWRLQSTLRAPGARSQTRGRAVLVGLGVLVAILATMSIALASSPDLRQQLAGMVGMASKGNRISTVQPPPPFTVFQPMELPAEMQLVAQAYSPGSVGNGQPSWSGVESGVARPSIVGASAQRAGSSGPDSQVLTTARRRAQDLLGTTKEATLVLVYASPDGRIVAVVEQSALGKTPSSGDPVTINRATGTVVTSDHETIVRWIVQNTFLQVYATMDRGAAIAFANDLQPTALTSAASTQAVAAQATALRALPTRIPLAQRVAAVETPTVNAAAVARTCGRWDPDLFRTAPTASFDQVKCVARTIVGIDQPGSSGLSRYSWHEAAARLGLDPSVGPKNDPTVWLAELDDRTESQGWVVVLDTQTGQPYLVVFLKAAQAISSNASNHP